MKAGAKSLYARCYCGEPLVFEHTWSCASSNLPTLERPDGKGARAHIAMVPAEMVEAVPDASASPRAPHVAPMVTVQFVDRRVGHGLARLVSAIDGGDVAELHRAIENLRAVEANRAKEAA